MTTYERRARFITHNLRAALSFDALIDVATDCVMAADYSPRHAKRVAALIARVADSGLHLTVWVRGELLAVIWNACTWAGLDPQRQLNEWTAADLADQMADDEVDTPTSAWIAPADDARYEDESRSSFDLLLIDRRPMAGDCGPDEDPDVAAFAFTLHEMDLPNYWS